MDYVLDVGGPATAANGNQAGIIGTLAANTKYPGLLVQLQPDAPFILRGMAARMTWSLENGQNSLSQLYFRLKTAGTTYSTNLVAGDNSWVPFSLFARAFGQGGNQGVWWPHQEYPANGTIEIDLWNNGAATLPGVQIVFRGVKRFTRPVSPTYPAKITRTLNWSRAVKIYGVGISGSTALVRQYLYPAISDADFVFRHIQGGCVYNDKAPGAFFPARNVWVTLRDTQEWAYSNLPVDINILCGQSTMQTASGLTGHAQFGNWHPGIIYPELYIKKNELYSLEVVRDDSSYGAQAGIGAERLDFALGGIKVFSR